MVWTSSKPQLHFLKMDKFVSSNMLSYSFQFDCVSIWYMLLLLSVRVSCFGRCSLFCIRLHISCIKPYTINTLTNCRSHFIRNYIRTHFKIVSMRHVWTEYKICIRLWANNKNCNMMWWFWKLVWYSSIWTRFSSIVWWARKKDSKRKIQILTEIACMVEKEGLWFNRCARKK